MHVGDVDQRAQKQGWRAREAGPAGPQRGGSGMKLTPEIALPTAAAGAAPPLRHGTFAFWHR